ncbi:hypothetical protein MNBD_PLANCTO02-127 [hydrothermal vent metagenome]|uniref:Arylamine N-acetyltransferase n=1 Tax=hydrothermal vent metagenome TaxID=652676 RepID=A0A3B1DSD0_9ZZZZ
MKTTLNIDSYLERIQFSDTPRVDLSTLRELHKQHVFTIPFENLDIHFGNPISLEISSLFKKLILNKRGGYCFELNGLFQSLLESLGFQVFSTAGRVLFDSEGIPPRSHRLLIVTLEKEQWLVDVGFGAYGLLEPIPLIVGGEYTQFGEEFKLEHDHELGFIFKSKVNHNWISQYTFTLEPHLPVDFIFPNYYHSHSPESIFTQKKICQLPTPEGRKKLAGMKLSLPHNGQSMETVARNQNEYIEMLKTHFNIEIPATPNHKL